MNLHCRHCGRPIPGAHGGAGVYCNGRCASLAVALRKVRHGSAGDLPADTIERIFARTKARLRYERALAQGER